MLFEEVVEQAVNPDWEGFNNMTKHVHEWRSYIPEQLEKRWFEIPLESRMYMIAVAEDAAGRENWD